MAAIHLVNLTNVPVEDVHVEEVFETSKEDIFKFALAQVKEVEFSLVLFDVRIVTSLSMLFHHRDFDYEKLLRVY